MKEQDRYKNVNYCLKCGAPLEIAPDREGKTRPQCSTCGWIYYKNPIPAVACVVINSDNQLLLIKRRFEPKADMWATPSGYVEIWQTLEDAAIEELHEETGLIGEPEQFLGYHMDFSPLYERVLTLGFKMKVTGGVLQAGDDAIEARFFPLNELPEIAFMSHITFLKALGIKIK